MSVCEHRTRKECYQALCVPGQRARLEANPDQHHAVNLINLATNRNRGDVIRMVADLGLFNAYHNNALGFKVPRLYTALSRSSDVCDDVIGALVYAGGVCYTDMCYLRARVIESHRLSLEQKLSLLKAPHGFSFGLDADDYLVLAIRSGQHPIVYNEIRSFMFFEDDGRVLTAALESKDPVIIDAMVLIGFNHHFCDGETRLYAEPPSFEDICSMIPEWEGLPKDRIDFIKPCLRWPGSRVTTFQHITRKICPDICQKIIEFPFGAGDYVGINCLVNIEPKRVFKDVVAYYQTQNRTSIKSASKKK